MPSSSARSPAGRQLAAELRRIRERAGRTVADVAAELSWSSAKLSRVENAINGVNGQDLARLLGLYVVNEADRGRLNDLAARARQPTSRAPYGETLPDVLAEFIVMEAEATTISTYGAIVVPGLLQTAEYAGAITQAMPARGADMTQDVLTARMSRQAILARPVPPALHVVIDEAVLRRPVGGPEVLSRQMLRLIEASRRPATSIRVLPFSIGAHPAITGHFTLLDFADGNTPTHVFCDGLTGGVMRSSAEDVRRYRFCFEALIELALTEEESVELISAIARGDRG
jgi:transcriptional regulator with XRE-family HTH domain